MPDASGSSDETYEGFTVFAGGGIFSGQTR